MARKTTATETIGRVGRGRQVVIPREFLETLNIREGDLVMFSRKADGVLIKAKRLVDDDTRLTAEEAKIVRQGEAQLKRCASKPWHAVKHALSR
jgi:AbrB family looped-hinge helix DNA binding protein